MHWIKAYTQRVTSARWKRHGPEARSFQNAQREAGLVLEHVKSNCPKHGCEEN